MSSPGCGAQTFRYTRPSVAVEIGWSPPTAIPGPMVMRSGAALRGLTFVNVEAVRNRIW